MYTLRTATNSIHRDSDGHQVAPCQSAEDPDFLAYIDWAGAGNEPAIDGTPAPPPVPEVVTMAQARLALLHAGLLATASNALAAMPGIEGDAARIEWEFRAEVHRQSALVVAVAAMLGLDDAAIDGLFRAAATL